jgi:hypothetical protein
LLRETPPHLDSPIEAGMDEVTDLVDLGRPDRVSSRQAKYTLHELLSVWKQ